MSLDILNHVAVPFEQLSGRGVRVAIVDTGVDTTHAAVGSVTEGVSFALASGNIQESAGCADDFGHGTACAAIVRKLAPRCDVLAAKISRGGDPIPAQLLAAGIDWAVRRGADVINVSAGTTGAESGSLLIAACERAAAVGSVVVAAAHTDGEVAYPAALESVISVGGDVAERRPYAFRCDPALARRFDAYGGYQRVAWLSPRFLFLCGASFAAARMSGIIALVLEKLGRLPYERLLQILRYNSINGSAAAWEHLTCSSLPYPPARSIEWIRRAAFFPFTKEMHSLVRFRHLLPFEVVGVVDPIAKGFMGKDASEALGLPPSGLRVTANLQDGIREADTLILGFTSKLSAAGGTALSELAGRAIEEGRNVYTFEPLSLPKYGPLLLDAARKGVKAAWPEVDDVDLEELRTSVGGWPGNYARVPILAVVGTSTSQGKFTLQLVLREGLRRLGLNVAQIGTEHQACLFGMEDCFPIGHVKNVRLKQADWREYFDLRYRQIARDSKPDIFIVGSQGGILPYALRDSGGDGFAFMHLMAIRADSYALVVNHDDEAQFIQDTIDALRIIGKGRTILLALSNRRKYVTNYFGRRILRQKNLDPREQDEVLERLRQRFRIPAFNIVDPNGSGQLIDAVVRAYKG